MKIRVCGLVEGLMVYWDEVENAAQYHVHLFIGDWNSHTELINGSRKWVHDEKETVKEIAVVDVDRNFKYYSFKGLARIHVEFAVDSYGRHTVETGRHYYVMVEAEDRNGNIIEASDKTVGQVLQMDNGFAN